MSYPAEQKRIYELEKKRKLQHELVEKQKDEIKRKHEIGDEVKSIGHHFTKHTSSVADAVVRDTAGLKTKEQFAEISQSITAAAEKDRQEKEARERHDMLRKAKKKKSKKSKLVLSFSDEFEEGNEESPAKKIKVTKDPTIDTSFLPDREREEWEREQRSKFRREFVEEQEKMKAQEIEVTFSYWDGRGHRRSCTVTKGTTIAQFLEIAKKQFKELQRLPVDNLLFVKEDLILPHEFTFYDFMVNKARGKSGPLFLFTVKDDVRLLHDATVEKEETHAGKVVERHWYEKNKHIFPASRWETYDPLKQYTKYTSHGEEVN